MANVRYNFGYRTSNFNTFNLIDTDRLALELAIKGVTCEFPGCDDLAFGVIRNGITGLICLNHLVAYESSKPDATKIETAIMRRWQATMMIAADRAWQGSEEDEVTSFVGTGSILDRARTVVSDEPLVLGLSLNL